MLYTATSIILITCIFPDGDLSISGADKDNNYRHSSINKTYTYRTTNTDVREGDIVVVPVYSNTGVIKLARATNVRRFDPERDSESDFLAEASRKRWMVDHVDVAAYSTELNREADQKRALQMLADASRLITAEEQFEKVRNKLDPGAQAFIAKTLGLDNALPAPQSSGKLEGLPGEYGINDPG